MLATLMDVQLMAAMLGEPDRLTGRTNLYPDVRYFGVGNDSRRENATRFGYTPKGGGATRRRVRPAPTPRRGPPGSTRPG